MKVVQSTTLYEGKFTGIREIVEREDGKHFTYETIRHPGAVVILPVDQQGNLVLIRQYRHSIGAEILEVPAGTLEKGEDPYLCAQRELSEEIGMAAKDWIPLGAIWPAPGFCDECQHLYLARSLYSKIGIPDEDEMISTVLMSVSEVERAMKEGTLRDAKTMAIFLQARLMGYI